MMSRHNVRAKPHELRIPGNMQAVRYSAPSRTDVSYPRWQFKDATRRNGRLHLPALSSRCILGTRTDCHQLFGCDHEGAGLGQYSGIAVRVCLERACDYGVLRLPRVPRAS